MNKPKEFYGQSVAELINSDEKKKVVFMMARRSGKSLFSKLVREEMARRDKLAQENAALHQTAAFLADEARRTEKAMERGRYRR
jgi:hypothetical protein